MDIGNPGQSPDGCGVVVGNAYPRTDGVRYLAELVRDLAELPIVGLDRLHQALDPFVYRHVTFFSILPVSRAGGAGGLRQAARAVSNAQATESH